MSYDIRVTAINKSGKSDAQTVSNVMLPNPTPTPKPVPEKVTGLRVKSVTSSSVTLSWNSAKNATSYRVYWKRNSETDWQVEGTTSSTSYQVINLYSNAGYDFKVVAERNGEKAADTVLKNVKTSVEAFHDGNLKDTSIKVSIGFRYRDPETDKIMEVKSFVSNTMVQNIRRKNYSYGVYYEFDLPWLATSRYYTMRVDIEAPDGYQRTCYLDEGFSFENLGSSAEWSWSILGENFFSDLFDAYGTIPKGTYTITFYWNDMLVNATSFNVT